MENRGVYSHAQQQDGDLIREYFPSNDGDRWRAPNMDANGALVYLGNTNQSTYSRYYELKSDYNTNACPRLINAIYVLNNTSSNLLREKVDSVLAVDRWLWFLAIENIFADDDSYWNKGSDYMMYYEPESGRIHPAEHDGNEAFFSGDVALSPVYGDTIARRSWNGSRARSRSESGRSPKSGRGEVLGPLDLLERPFEIESRELGRHEPANFEIGEEEIVRVELESTTSDVISVRARSVRGGIAWRVVDEYPDRGEYVVKPQFSRGPLSLAELIGMLDGASYNGPFEGGLPLGWNINSLECGGGEAAELRHFTTVESSFYPELFAHYENVYDEWVEERDGAVADDEEGAEAHEQEDAGGGDEGDEDEDAA